MESPPALQLTAEQARELNSRGATLLLLNVPARTQLGFDYLTFTTADKFRGIKMIPPGTHLLHLTPPPSHSHDTASAAPALPAHRWLYLHTAQIVVRRYAQPTVLHPLADGDEERRYQLGVARFDFDSGLGPYQPRREWAALSGWLSEAVVVRLEEERERMERVFESRWRLEDKHEAKIEEVKEAEEERKDVERPVAADRVESDEKGRETDEQKAAAQQRIQRERAASNTARRQQLSQLTEQYTAIYTPIPPLVIPANTLPAAVTRMHLDRSLTVEQLLAALTRCYSRSSASAFELLLAELQHSFLSFLVAHDPSAFSYYKHLLTVLSLSPTHLTTHPQRLSTLLATLRPQLSELPGDWLHDPLSSDSFMLECVQRLLDVAEEGAKEASDEAASGWAEVAAESGKVEALLDKKFGWHRRREAEGVAEDDDDEYAPVVVQLPLDQTDDSDATMAT